MTNFTTYCKVIRKFNKIVLYEVTGCYPEPRSFAIARIRFRAGQLSNQIVLPTLLRFERGDLIEPTLELRAMLRYYKERLSIDKKYSRYNIR